MNKKYVAVLVTVLGLGLGASVYSGATDAEAAAIKIQNPLQAAISFAEPIACDSSVVYVKGFGYAANNANSNFSTAFDRVRASNAGCDYGIRVGSYEILCPGVNFRAINDNGSKYFHCELQDSNLDVFQNLGRWKKSVRDGNGIVRMGETSTTDIEVKTLQNGWLSGLLR